MENRFILNKCIIDNNRISYEYEVYGEWKKIFKNKPNFFAEYSYNISGLPESIAVIPLICNILPMAWLFNAEISVECCDEDFFNSIDDFKEGYKNMYPDLKFKGKFIAKTLQKNKIEDSNGSICFFSGGVDAFNTLFSHVKENVTLLTVWGADVKLCDLDGWKNVQKHIKETSRDFDINYITVKSNLKDFFDKDFVYNKIKHIGKDWWHDFQHGIGIISFAAPISFISKKMNVYIASSFTEKDKGTYTCASDPTIDNFVKFCDSNVIHDGYEYTRQDKVHNIVQYCKEYSKNIELRVCWESTGGKNCCSCEKCYRTMLAIFAEGEDPKNYGFDYSKKQLKEIKYCQDRRFNYSKYGEIQARMREKCNITDIPKEIRWFYRINIKNIGHNLYKVIGKIKNKIKKL
mgnify:CR=1 FL=1